MKKNRTILSLIFTRNIYYVILLFIIIFSGLYLGFEYYYKNNLVATEKDSVISSVRSFLEMGSNFLVQYNDTYRRIAREQLIQLSDIYRDVGTDGVAKAIESLSFEDKTIKGIHYYIIEDGTITRTNYPRDKGLNIKKIVPIFWKDLQQNLQEDGDVYIENISYEVNTNHPRVFAYRRIDENTIFEIGLQIQQNEFDTFISNLNNLEIKSNIQKIEAYNIQYIPFDESFVELTPFDKQQFESLASSQEETIVDETPNKKILYIKWIPGLEDVHSTINIRVVLDFTQFSTLRNRFFLIMIIVLPLLSLLMLFINYRNSKKLLDPLTEKIKLIDSASVEPQRTAADSRTGVYELDVLQAYYQNEIEKRENLNTLLEDEKQQVEKSLAQRELLLREIHHRVKNNLNIIASLLKLQSSSISDEQMKKHFMDAQNRVASMSLIHEKLYNHDLSGVHIKKYLDDLISQLIDTYRSPHRVVQTHIDVPDVHMPLDTAVPLGLIVNELITNSLEHGFDQLREGRIEILMREEGANYTLTISDNGVGLPADLDVSSSSSLGLSLVSTLAKQLKGSFEFFNDNGTVARITFRVIGG